jgi:hypothetical protein
MGWQTVTQSKPNFRLEFHPQVHMKPWGIWLCEKRNRSAGKVPLEILDVRVGTMSEFATGAPMPFEAFNLQWFRFMDATLLSPGIMVCVEGRIVQDFPFRNLQPGELPYKQYKQPRIFVSGVVAFESIPNERWEAFCKSNPNPFQRKEKTPNAEDKETNS